MRWQRDFFIELIKCVNEKVMSDASICLISSFVSHMDIEQNKGMWSDLIYFWINYFIHNINSLKIPYIIIIIKTFLC